MDKHANQMSPRRHGDAVLISIEAIVPNRYQRHDFRDEAKVLEIAESLKQNQGNGSKGLWQVPTARQIDGAYELAFGHHRLYAFQHLAAEDPFFQEMPLLVKDLSDQEMFEAMGTENLQRRDISFIEEGELYQAYMTTFDRNSVETAMRFGKTEEHVRGRIMFLQLPEIAKEKAKAGELNVSTARSLVTANRLLGNEGVELALKHLDSEVYDTPQEAIAETIQASEEVRRMEYKLPWLDLAGKKFPIKHLPPLSWKLAAELLDVANEDVERKKLLAEVIGRLENGEEFADALFPSFLPGQLEKVRILANPPACTACPFHAAFDGNHYCGLKACYERKEKAWAQAELEKLWKKIGIPPYVNEATDGKAVELSHWDQGDQKLFKERHADLRLKQTTRSVWNNFEGLPNNAVLVAVGKLAEKKLKASEHKAENEQTEALSRELVSKMRNLTDGHLTRFLWNAAAPAFEGLLEGMNNLPFTLFLYGQVMSDSVDFLYGMDSKEEQLHQIENAKRKAEAWKQLRRLMMAEVLEHALRWDSYNNQLRGAKKPIMELAKRAQKRAEEWHWKLPRNWLAGAEKYQAELDAALKELKAAAKVKA